MSTAFAGMFLARARRYDFGVALALAARREGEHRAVEILDLEGTGAMLHPGKARQPSQIGDRAPPRRGGCRHRFRASRRSFAAASAPSPTMSTTRPATLWKAGKTESRSADIERNALKRPSAEYGVQGFRETAMDLRRLRGQAEKSFSVARHLRP